MIHINKSSDKKYYITVTADNGEILSTSETLNTKQSAWKNIYAQAKSFGSEFIKVTDTTSKLPVFKVYDVNTKKIVS